MKRLRSHWRSFVIAATAGVSSYIAAQYGYEVPPEAQATVIAILAGAITEVKPR